MLSLSWGCVVVMVLGTATFVTAMYLVAAAGQEGDAGPFSTRLATYAELHRAASTQAGAASGPAAAAALAERIRAQRSTARAGEFFGSVAPQIREAINAELTGARGHVLLAAIEESNVHGARVRVNHRYPPGLPRATMPGQLLAKLPPLPPMLEYRFLGRSLLLVDAPAGLVVDMLPDVLPVQVVSTRTSLR